jgi:hypothetical protein
MNFSLSDLDRSKILFNGSCCQHKDFIEKNQVLVISFAQVLFFAIISIEQGLTF